MAQAYAGQLPRQPVHMQGLSHHELDIRHSYHDQSSEIQTSGMTARLHMIPCAIACNDQGGLKTGMYG